LAAGGSFYILILIAGLDLKWKITRSGSRIPWEVAKMLRRPETSKTPELITDRIIPTIAWMRSHFPLSLERIFCASFLASSSLKETLDCTDLSLTDSVLDRVKQKCVVMFS
ncbi:hypothetical protein M405DRAFT_750570, partial [Rhizopogon salebrosus TDB-379]